VEVQGKHPTRPTHSGVFALQTPQIGGEANHVQKLPTTGCPFLEAGTHVAGDVQNYQRAQKSELHPKQHCSVDSALPGILSIPSASQRCAVRAGFCGYKGPRIRVATLIAKTLTATWPMRDRQKTDAHWNRNSCRQVRQRVCHETHAWKTGLSMQLRWRGPWEKLTFF